jgi:hypothetical protein
MLITILAFGATALAMYGLWKMVPGLRRVHRNSKARRR